MTSFLERLPESSWWLMILLKMTALLAAAWMAHWLLLGRNPRWRVMLWRGVIAGLVVLPMLELALPAVQVKVPSPAPRVIARPETGALTSDWFSRRPAGYAWRGGGGTFEVRPEPSLLERAQANTGWLVAIGWGLVAAILAARTLLMLVRVRKIVKGASPAPLRVTTLLERIARDMQCSRHVGLRLTAALVSPFLTRVVRPVILLPERMTAPQRCKELDGVLAHELAHVRGNDLVWLLLARALSCVLWFHPLAWKIAAAHGQACEEVCDAVAARYVGGAPAYSGMLARVALELMTDAPADGGVAMVRAASILQRVRRIKQGIEAAAPARRWIIAALAGGALTLLALGSLKVVYAEQDKQSQAAATRPVANAATQTQPGREKTLMRSQATVKREGDKVWIEGVKGWSIPEMPSSVHGAQMTIMQALGEKVTYEELVGASGLAFRMQVSKEGICPSSPHSFCGWRCVSNSNRMLPWKIRVIEVKADDAEAAAEARNAVMASIDRGVPVQYGSEEDGVIVGYQKGGQEWLCLHPYSKGGNTVFVNTKWPWGIAIYTEHKTSVPSRRDVATEALRQAVGMARTKEVDVYQMGFAAWEGWIEKVAALGSADEKTRKDSMQGNSWIYLNLTAGRQVAAKYLRSISPEFGDEAAGHLRKAADLYERMASEVLLTKGQSPEEIAPGPWSMKPGQTWTAETRAEQVRRLKAALPLEREAVGEIAKALEIEKIDVSNAAPPASGKTEAAASQTAKVASPETPVPVGGRLRTGPGNDAEWLALQGAWLIDAAGRIVGSSDGNGYLCRALPHPDDVRVTATLRAAAGDEVTVWICGSPERTEFAGYTLAVSTSGAKLQRQGKDVTRTSAARIEPGKDHVLAFERSGAVLRGFLDGSADPFIVWIDAQPLHGPGHTTLGFYVCSGTISIADVKVEALPPQRVTPAATAASASAPTARLDFSNVTLRGNPCAEDSFAKAVQAAAKLLGREVDLQTVLALSTNAFAPNVRTCEPCKSWWDVQAQDRAIDLVARRIGLQVRPLPALDHSADPPMPKDPEAVKAWDLAYMCKPIVPAIRKALDSGEVVIAGNEWDFKFHSNAWFGWGIITDAREDGTILGACLNGRRDNPMNYVDNAWVLSAGEPTMSTHAADVEMLRLAVDRIRGNLEPTRANAGGVKIEYVFGLEAMDAWIHEMQTVPGFCAECQARGGGWSDAVDCAKLMHGGAVLAASYLRSNQDGFAAGGRPHLEAAAKQYDRIAQLLRPANTTSDPGHYKTFIGDLDKQKAHAEQVLRPVRNALAAAGDEMAKALAAEGVAVKSATVKAISTASQPAASAVTRKAFP